MRVAPTCGSLDAAPWGPELHTGASASPPTPTPPLVLVHTRLISAPRLSVAVGLLAGALTPYPSQTLGCSCQICSIGNRCDSDRPSTLRGRSDLFNRYSQYCVLFTFAHRSKRGLHIRLAKHDGEVTLQLGRLDSVDDGGLVHFAGILTVDFCQLCANGHYRRGRARLD